MVINSFVNTVSCCHQCIVYLIMFLGLRLTHFCIVIPHIHVHLFPGLNTRSLGLCCIRLSVNPFIISAGADSTCVFLIIKMYLEDVSHELPNLGNVTQGLEIRHECHSDLRQTQTKSVCHNFEEWVAGHWGVSLHVASSTNAFFARL